jgi:hypothetical protein
LKFPERAGGRKSAIVARTAQGTYMSLSDLASIGSFVSGLAVLASLIYLGLQIRQNTLTHRATAHMGRYAFAREQAQMMMDPKTAAIALKGFQDIENLSEVEAYQLHNHLQTFILGSEEMYWLHGQGSLDDHAFEMQMSVFFQILGSPAGRASWEIGKSLMAPPFQKYVDQKLASLPIAPPPPFLVLWKSAVGTR